MARPLRIEFPGAVYFITSEGNAGQNIFLDSEDANGWIDVFDSVCKRFKWTCYAYCLMGNIYYLIIETKNANLSKGMRQLNGVYTQNFNRRHSRGGHIFQGRYKSILVQKEKYLKDLARFILLKPVNAGFTKLPQQFKWSSSKYFAAKEIVPEWLKIDELNNLLEDIMRYKDIDITNSIKRQIYLGDDNFIESVNEYIDEKKDFSEIPKEQRTYYISLDKYESLNDSRDKAIAEAYLSGNHSMKKISEHFSLHYSTVSRIIKNYENSK